MTTSYAQCNSLQHRVGMWFKVRAREERCVGIEGGYVWRLNESCHRYEWVMSHIWMSHVTYMNVMWRCDMTHSYVWHDSFICVIRLIHMCDMTNSRVWHDQYICVTWLIHIFDMPHSHTWHDPFICMTWLIRMCDMTVWHLYEWRDSFIFFATNYMMTHTYVWN